jgi:hypothetical protein
MIGLSGLEFKILELAERDGYSVTMDGPWWMKLLYDFGILQIYINRMVENGLLEEVRTGWKYRTTSLGFWTYIDYVMMGMGNR